MQFSTLGLFNQTTEGKLEKQRQEGETPNLLQGICSNVGCTPNASSLWASGPQVLHDLRVVRVRLPVSWACLGPLGTLGKTALSTIVCQNFSQHCKRIDSRERK